MKKAVERLKNAIGLEEKDFYTEDEFFDELESAYLWLYDEAQKYTSEDSAALGEVAENGGTLDDLEFCFKALIDAFISWCEEEVTDGINVGIQECFDDVENRSWWVKPLMRRYREMLELCNT